MAKDTFLNGKTTVNAKGRLLDLAMPSVMAILNITPDSFYSQSRSLTVDDALRRAEGFLRDGAKFIDIGAYSSRPGAADISADEELQRLLPVVEAITKKLPEALLSVDTFRARVALEAIHAGAHVINDISGGSMDELMFKTVAQLQVPYILMHMKGTPQTMQQHAQYQDISLEVIRYFADKVADLQQLGVKDIIIDPGFGFSKTPVHNYELFRKLDHLQVLGLPMLVGISRKSMIYKTLAIDPEEALNATTALHMLALQRGTSILRVHDVKEAIQCIKILNLASHEWL